MVKPKRDKPSPIHNEESPMHGEPVRTLEPSRLECEICGKVFKTHSELDRHLETMHGEPERTHMGPHTGTA